MKKQIMALIAAALLLCTGCASLLDRSYSSVEPYTNRFWDSTAEDTLKAENYQDLVNSLLMLVAQQREEGVIRYYVPEDGDGYAQALKAKTEVQTETLIGSYLLNTISVIYAKGEGYCTLTCYMTYRTDVPDPASLMPLTDTQSLKDLLRVSVREGHESLTAQFIAGVSRNEVKNAVDEVWKELFLAEAEENAPALPPAAPGDGYAAEPGGDGTGIPGDGSGESGSTPAEPPSDGSSAEPESPAAPDEPSDAPPAGSESTDTDETGENAVSPDETGDGAVPPAEEPIPPEIVIPPCPWTIRFYPDTENAEIVEIILK